MDAPIYRRLNLARFRPLKHWYLASILRLPTRCALWTVVTSPSVRSADTPVPSEHLFQLRMASSLDAGHRHGIPIVLSAARPPPVCAVSLLASSRMPLRRDVSACTTRLLRSLAFLAGGLARFGKESRLLHQSRVTTIIWLPMLVRKLGLTVSKSRTRRTWLSPPCADMILLPRCSSNHPQSFFPSTIHLLCSDFFSSSQPRNIFESLRDNMTHRRQVQFNPAVNTIFYTPPHPATPLPSSTQPQAILPGYTGNGGPLWTSAPCLLTTLFVQLPCRMSGVSRPEQVAPWM